MAVLPICIAGETVLHHPTRPILEYTEELAELIRDMYETMDAANGVGLAANQIGSDLRVFVYDCPDVEGPGGEPLTAAEIAGRGGPRRRGCVVNPVLETGELPLTMPDPDEDDEGCLSVPGVTWPRGRADWARVTGTDEHGDPVDIEGHGLFARCLQHEVGHLDGFLYTDGLVGRHQRAAKKHFKKAGWGVPGLTWMPGVDADPFGHDD